MDKLPKADRRGNTILVPLGIAVVGVVLIALMLVRGVPDGTDQPPRDKAVYEQPSK